MIDIGIHVGMPWEEYRAIDLPNQSMLKNGCRSMLRLKRYMDGEIQLKPETVTVGNAVHCMVAGELGDRYAEVPDFENDDENLTKGRKTKAGYVDRKKTASKSTEYYKSKVAEWESELGSREKINGVQLATARKCYLQIKQNRQAAELIGRSQLEVVVIGEIEGIRCKARVDGFDRDSLTWWDLKTTSDIEMKAFYRQFKNLRYGFQIAFHDLLFQSAGLQMQQFKFIAAEVQGDYDVGVLDVPNGVWERDHDLVSKVVDHYRICKASGRWPGMYPNGDILDVPNWDMSNDEQLVGFDQ